MAGIPLALTTRTDFAWATTACWGISEPTSRWNFSTVDHAHYTPGCRSAIRTERRIQAQILAPNTHDRPIMIDRKFIPVASVDPPLQEPRTSLIFPMVSSSFGLL